MALYDRDYMGGRRGGRGDLESPFQGGGFGKIFGGGAAGALIMANLVCFILVAFAERALGGGFVTHWLALSIGGLGDGALWEFISYAFVHEGLFHIFANMIGLYFVGKILQAMIGNGKFLFVYFFGALLGGAAWLATSFGANECLVGASAAVMSVFACFCMLYTQTPVCFLLFFVLPVRLKPIVILKLVAGFEIFGLLYSLAGGGTVVAYSAHLGGMAAGWISARIIANGGLNALNSFSLKKIFSSAGNKKKRKASDYFYKVNIDSPSSGPSLKEIDRILDKISSSGFASLTEGERETLRRARGFDKR